MKRTLLAGLAVGASVLVAPAAHAATSDAIHGGCRYSVYNEPKVGDTWAGLLVEESVTTTGDSPPKPIGATVTCWIEVNGVPVPETKHSYGDVGGVTGVQAGVAPVSFSAGALDIVSGCETDAFADGTTWSLCYSWGDTVQLPPQVVSDVLSGACAVIDPGDDCPLDDPLL